MSELKAKASGGSIGSGGYKKDEEIKLSDLPEFDGTLDPEVYLDWERRVDRIFSHKGIDDYKCFTYAILKLSKLASLWVRLQRVLKKSEKLGKDIKVFRIPLSLMLKLKIKELIKMKSSVSKCQGRGHYKSECPNRRVMTLTRYQALEEEDAKLALLLKRAT
uniref:Uncharacterized protein n=1 Tax=Chenopodium quinoa TaxID=63459 RepID=A0A803NEP8_CHEQI